MAEVPVRILIVDDSELYRTIVRHVLSQIPNVEVIGAASNGLEAVSMIERHAPDLITLDVEMPVLDGLGVLDEMRRRNLKSSAIMLSSLTEEGAQATLQSLSKGAFDFVLKPTGGSTPENKRLLREVLTEKIKAWRYSRRSGVAGTTAPRGTSLTPRRAAGDRPSQFSTTSNESIWCDSSSVASFRGDGTGAVVIGASTGGPDALRHMLPKIPADFPLPILVVQHMPTMFTRLMAENLNGYCKLKVSEARRYNLVEPGRILIAPGGQHMKVWKNGQAVRVDLTDDAPEHSCRPSVDYLFRSAAEVFGAGTVGVIMTGMGHDGAEGCRRIKRAGGMVMAQDEESCVVYGMPRLPVEEGIADRVVPLDRLATTLRQVVRSEATV